jgi:hypothetical protein
VAPARASRMRQRCKTGGMGRLPFIDMLTTIDYTFFYHNVAIIFTTYHPHNMTRGPK